MTSVINISYKENGIALIGMEDRINKNTFSQALIDGLSLAFSEVTSKPEVKVIVIHGYEGYFCCGGTKEELLELTAGNKNFADFGFYRLLFDCPLPVIAAMQGHALGAGFVFGTSADILVIAEEAFYATNFMKYGFTPGFGATYLLPKKFGVTIAENMLFGAQNYQGSQLKNLLVPAIFAKKNNVIEIATKLADDLAKKSRNDLISLKRNLTKTDRVLLPKYIDQEIAMHKVTFKLPEVKNNILELFGQ